MAAVQSPIAAGKGSKVNTTLNRSIMAKKYRMSSNEAPYVEQSTLLAPENQEKHAWVRIKALIQLLSAYLQIQELHAEERKDISDQLAKLRKQHDDVKKLSKQRQLQVEECKKEIQQLTEVCDASMNKTQSMTEKKELLEQQLQETTIKMQEEQLLSDSYQHMQVRLKKDLICMQIKNLKSQDSLKDKSMISEIQEEKSRKSNASKQKANRELKDLVGTMEQENIQRELRMKNLSMAIQSKKDAEQRKQDRLKRQMEIAEAAANQNKDSSELQMRESFLVHKFWNAVLKRRMEGEMKRSAPIEEAFQKIRTATGLSDVTTFVNKFLTREQQYSQLLVTVAQSASKIDVLKMKNSELQNQLKEQKIDSQGIEAGHDQDVSNSEKKLESKRKQLKELQNKFQKAQIIYDKVKAWSKRVGAKLPELEDNLNASQAKVAERKAKGENESDVKYLFDSISGVVCSTLQTLGGETGDNSGLMSEFMSDSFIQKNIRVRPSSAVATADETSSKVSHGQSPHRGEDEHQKFNQMVNMEMEEQRNQIKERLKQQADDIIRKKKAKEEKK